VTTKDQRYEKMTRDELYDLAQEREIEGRAELSKEELVSALTMEDLGPDAVQLLRRQHDEIRRLFGEFDERSSRPSKKKEEIVRELITTLVKHAEIEEQVFYPAVREELKGLDSELDEDLEEHHAAELLLWELDHLSSKADRYDAKVTVLKENILHHIEEEESDLFPEVEEQMGEERRRELGTAMETVWRVAPTRPHPLTPDTPPGNVIAGIPGTVIDLTVGAARGVKRLVRRG
jgi:hemerythrin superfamily protein